MPELYLYETHLPVRDTERARQFYCETVGLGFAFRDPDRDIVFLWVGSGKRSMLGLWGPGTKYGRSSEKQHLAFALSLSELLAAGRRLEAQQITTTNFSGEKTIEPSVIGWMPSAQLYFEDLDGHSLEYIAVLDDAPDPSFTGSLSEWQSRGAARQPS